MRLCGRTLAGALSLLLTVALAACTPRTRKQATPAESQKPVPVGSAACAACHADIAAKHAATNHALTLYPATLSALKGLAPPESELRPGLMLRRQGDLLRVEVKNPINGTTTRIPLALVLGSGKTGMTFVVDDGQAIMEISRSYFPHHKTWHITPGQELADPTAIGKTHDRSVASKCLSCHAVTSPELPLIPEKKFFGVGCESCHGFGSAHLKGAKMQDLKTLDGPEINTLCGRCHRTKEDVESMGASDRDSTQRFQPYGLTLSKCFIKSQGKLSCITCHDPHENASKDTPKYERTCRTCHDGSAKSKPLCPVNPKQDCVKCHMPTRDVFAGEPRLPIAMADHFIRIVKDRR